MSHPINIIRRRPAAPPVYLLDVEAAVGACFVRNLRWVADGAHVEFRRIGLRLAAERDDDPPAIRQIGLEVDLETDALRSRVGGILERVLRGGTITRTVARSAQLDVTLRVNGVATPIRVPDWHHPGSSRH